MKKILIAFLLLFSLFAQAQLNKPYFYYRGRDYIVAGRYRDAIESLNILLRNQPDEHEGYFLRGVAKYNLEDLNGALNDFSKALEEYPAYTQAYQYRAIVRSRMGLYNEALDDFAKAVEIRPNNAPVYYSRGVTYFLNRQFDRSISDFTKFLKLEPTQPEGYTSRGTSYLYMGDTLAAINDYNKAIKVNPYWSDGYLRRGLLSIMRTKYEDGARDLTSAIELDSTYAIAYFYRGVARNHLNDLRGSLNDFDASIKNDSTNAVAFFNRAILRSGIGDYNRAIDDYSMILLTNPDNVLVYYNRAHVYATIGDYKNAINDYTRAIELYPDFANAYRYRAQIKGMIGDKNGYYADLKIANAKIAQYKNKVSESTFSAYADTSKNFNKILSFDANFGNKDFANVRNEVSVNLKMLPMFRFTVSVPDTSFGYDPNRYENRKVGKFISDSRIVGLQLSNAPSVYSQYEIEYIDGANANPQTLSQIYNKAITQGLLSQYNSAMNYWDYLVSESGQDPFAVFNRGVTQAEMIEFIASLEGNYQSMNLESDPALRLKNAQKKSYDYSKAIADMQKTIELFPDFAHAYYNLGNLMYMIGDLASAIEMYNKAIELFPNFAQAYYNRGLVQFVLREKETGCMDVSKAGELGIVKAYELIREFCQGEKK